MRSCDLTSFVLQYVRIRTLQHARQSPAKSRRMITQLLAATSSFDSDQLHLLVSDEVVENSDSIRAAANARNDDRRQFALGFHNLRPRLTSDHSVKIAHHCRIGMRAQHAAQELVRC